MERKDQILDSRCALRAQDAVGIGTVMSSRNTEIKNLMEATILLREAILKCDEVLQIHEKSLHREVALRRFPDGFVDLERLQTSERGYQGQQGGATNNFL